MIAGGSFVSAVLDSIVIDEMSYRAITYLRWIDLNPTAVAEELETYRSAYIAAS